MESPNKDIEPECVCVQTVQKFVEAFNIPF